MPQPGEFSTLLPYRKQTLKHALHTALVRRHWKSYSKHIRVYGSLSHWPVSNLQPPLPQRITLTVILRPA
jgi:hypothetical protein